MLMLLILAWNARRIRTLPHTTPTPGKKNFVWGRGGEVGLGGGEGRGWSFFFFLGGGEGKGWIFFFFLGGGWKVKVLVSIFLCRRFLFNWPMKKKTMGSKILDGWHWEEGGGGGEWEDESKRMYYFVTWEKQNYDFRNHSKGPINFISSLQEKKKCFAHKFVFPM